MTTMAGPVPTSHGHGGGGAVQGPMTPNPIRRITKATLETPAVLLYAAAIVTILTVLYALLGG